MNKKGTIVTIVSLKTYFILIVIGIIVIFGYYYFSLKSLGVITTPKDCPSEIIPQRINCNLNERGSCTIGEGNWEDGTSIQSISGFTKGYKEGENINYLYPSIEGARSLPKYSRQDTGEDGIVKGKIDMGIYLILNLNDKTGEGYKVVESRCYFLPRSSDYYPKKDLIKTNDEETSPPNEEETTPSNTEGEQSEEQETIPTNDDEEQAEEQKTPEELLRESCLIEFTSYGIYNIQNTAYVNNIGGATTWLNANYISTGLTEEQRQFNIDREVSEANNFVYPLIIINGDFQEQPQVVSHGVRYCNEAGIIT